LLVTFIKGRRWLVSREFLGFQLCAWTAVSVNLITVFSVMHAYAGLPFIAMSLGFLITKTKMESVRIYVITFSLWLLSAIITDLHHIEKADESGRIGADMAQQVINQSDKPTDKVRILIIEDHYPRYSMFCVKPYDAFGWGGAVAYATQFSWPKEFDCVYIEENETHQIPSLIEEFLGEGFDAVWVLYKTNVSVETDTVAKNYNQLINPT